MNTVPPNHALLYEGFICFFIAGVMSVHNEVRVYVRTKPTAQFAQELIEYLPDKQVHRNEQGSRLLFSIFYFQRTALVLATTRAMY